MHRGRRAELVLRREGLRVSVPERRGGKIGPAGDDHGLQLPALHAATLAMSRGSIAMTVGEADCEISQPAGSPLQRNLRT
jgi:hypothetical protein